MIKHESTIAITKIEIHRPESATKNIRFTVGDIKIEIVFVQPAELEWDLFYVIASFEADDEQGGAIEFEAQVITFLDNKRRRPDETDLLYIAIVGLDQLNRSFHKEAKKMRFVFSEHIFPCTERVVQEALASQIQHQLDEFFPGN